MAYVNVVEWSPDQVTEWLKGLDNVILPYINSFLNNEVKGQQLLNLRSDDLENLGVYTLGHQELILEAVERLRNFHYELDRENIQLLALRLSCAAHSLKNALRDSNDTNKVETQTMSDVSNVISTIKPLVSWFDRSPFSGKEDYQDIRNELLSLSLKMATCAQRDRFAERPVTEIKNTSVELAKLADELIQDILDPMILQPASLDLATLKKRDNVLDRYIVPSFFPIHQFVESPLHSNGKIEAGDEIVQINYQTVVGWERKKVLLLYEESPPDVLLTLKKRPRHTKIYGQIYMKPYRLPSKKRALPYTRWHDNIPSPRPELLTIPDFEIPLPRVTVEGVPPQLPPTCSSDSDSCSSVSDSDGSPQQGLCPRVYPLKPRPVLQRRNTITGASPTTKGPNISIEQFWRELKTQAPHKHSSSSFIQRGIDSENDQDSPYIRDKAASYGHGLELNPRPSTVIGISQNNNRSKKTTNMEEKDTKVKFKINEKNTLVDDQKSVIASDKSEAKVKKKGGVRFEDDILDSNLSHLKVNIVNELMETKDSGKITNEVDNLHDALHVRNEDKLKFIDEVEDEVHDRSNLNDEWKNEIIEELIGTIQPKNQHPNKSTSAQLHYMENFNQESHQNRGNVNVLRDTEKQKQWELEKTVNLKDILEKNSKSKIKPVPKVRTMFQKNLGQDNVESNESIKNNTIPIICEKQVKVIKEFSYLSPMDITIQKFNKKPPEIPPKPDVLKKPVIPPRNFDKKVFRGRLDKSHSTPAYDTTESTENDINSTKQNTQVEKREYFVYLGKENMHKFSEKDCFPSDNVSIISDKIVQNREVLDNTNKFYNDNDCSVSSKNMNDYAKFEKNTQILQTVNTVLVQHVQRHDMLKVDRNDDSFVALNKTKNSNCDQEQNLMHKHKVEKTLGTEDSSYKNRVNKNISISPRNEAPPPPPRPSCSFTTESPSKLLKMAQTSKLKNSTGTELSDLNNSEAHLVSQDQLKCDETITMYIQEPNKLNIQHASKTKLIDQDNKFKMNNDKCEVKIMTPVVKAILSKGKTVKKKNSLLAKRRKVSSKDVSPGEIQGYLLQRSRKNIQGPDGSTKGRWIKRWFILHGSTLYGFKSEDATRADCLIFLAGFTVSVANEVNSMPHPFKVYHVGTVFYFSAENLEAMSTWVDLISLAILLTETSLSKHISDSNLFSETDDSDTDQKSVKSPEKVTETSKKFGSLKKLTSRKTSENTNSSENSGSTSLDRKYLRFFNSHSGLKSSKNANLPVPTAQFKSYRRKAATPTIVINQNISSQSNFLTDESKQDNKVNVNSNVQESKDNQNVHINVENSSFSIIEDTTSKTVPKPLKLSMKPKPINYIHASNPSLCDITDFKVPSFINKNRNVHRNDNLSGFITLEQFMLQRQEEERKQNPNYVPKNDNNFNKCIDEQQNNDNCSSRRHSHVSKTSENYLEPRVPSRKNSTDHSEHRKLSESHSYTSKSSDDQLERNNLCRKYSDGQAEIFRCTRNKSYFEDCLSNIQSRTLPKTPDKLYETQNRSLPRHSDVKKMSTDSDFESRFFKSGILDSKQHSEKKQNFFDNIKDRSYEIFCTGNSQNPSSQHQKKQHPPTPKHKNKIVRQHSLNSADRKIDKQSVFNQGDSPEKFWIDSLRRTDKVFASAPLTKEKSKLKSATQYTPMYLPLNSDQKLNPKFAFELNLDEKNVKSASKFKSFFGGSKTENEKTKEKTLLGSPRLHRAVFRKNQQQTCISSEIDGSEEVAEGTSPFNFLTESPVPLPVSQACTSGLVHPNHISPPPDYPGLEYPPVFEPETYSLTNPACSLSLLRKASKPPNSNK